MENEEIRKKLKDTFYKSLSLPLRATPLWLEAIGVGVFISRIVEKHPRFKERLKDIDGKVFRFEASDVAKGFYILIKDRDIKVMPHFAGSPDVTMRGEAATLIDVLTGKEDPDTVFFSRRLEITGDTATAIHLKNMLAALG